MITKIRAKETLEGDGVVVNRLFPITKRMNFDPFVYGIILTFLLGMVFQIIHTVVLKQLPIC